MVTGVAPSLRVTRSISSVLPTVMRASTGVACGHCARVASLGTRRSTRRVAPLAQARDSITSQGTVRAKPCPGYEDSVACGPNHGQQIGTPPRIDLPGANFAARESQITGCAPRGAQVMTCAPCRAMVAAPWLLATSATANPPGPSLKTTWPETP